MRTTNTSANGFEPPASVETARERLQACRTEMQRSFEQLVTVENSTLDWRQRVRDKIRAFETERQLLLDWIRQHEREEIRPAIIWCTKVLEDDEIVGIDLEEQLILTRCKKFLTE